MALSLANHRVVNGHDAVQHPFYVHIDTAIPGLTRDGVILIKSEWHSAGVVHQNVDPTKRIHRRTHGIIQVGAVTNITLVY